MSENPLGERIQQARLERGMSLRELEAQVGVSNAHLSQLETGKMAKPSLALLYAVANALDIEYAELLRLAQHVDPTDASAVPSAEAVGVALNDITDLTAQELEELQRFAKILRRRREGPP